MVAAAEMRHAGAYNGIRELDAAGDAQAAVIDEGAAAPFGGVELVHRRIVDDAGDQLALSLERDRDGEYRDAVQEIGRAVERVDDPAVLAVIAVDRAAFFHQEGIARPRTRELGVDDFLGLAVGLADIVARTFQRDLQVLHFAEVARQRTAGLDCGLNHDVEDR